MLKRGTKIVTEQENEKVVEETNKEEKEKKSRKIEKLHEEIEKLKVDLEHWKNEYYRAYADTQNLRKSLEKDHQEAMRYRSMGFLEELLPILDSFHLALKDEPNDPNLKNYLIGFQYIYRNFVAALENEGVKEISPQIGDKFDQNTMNALEVIEKEGEEDGKVLAVHAKGYKLYDRLVRPANVSVSGRTKKEETNQGENNQTQKFDA